MNKTLITAAVLALAACASAPAGAQQTPPPYKVSFYGHIKTDFAYDTKGVAGDDYTQYVATERALDRDFRASARGTRLGLDLSDGDKVSGKVEADFLGLSENVETTSAGGPTTDLRLRHAYVAFKAGKFQVLAGQTWHLLPLELSGTNNEFALGYSGALWYRAPQLRLTYAASERLSFSAAAVRPTRKLTDAEGTASGLPQAQAQAQLKLGKARLTLMGAYGQWRNTATLQKGEVQLADFGYSVPLTGALTLNGQVWTGQNLYDFLGGIGNMGYGPAEAKASGGFANLLVRPAGRFSYNIAYGVDNPVNSRLAAGSRTKNATLLANATCQVYEKVGVTLEAARQVTEYKLAAGYEDRENLHYQLSFKFPF